MLNIVNKTDCCACSACYNICPKHCISMLADVVGFISLAIDKSICVNCGLCEKVCPLLGAQETNNVHAAYALININDDILQTSASGGIFIELARWIIQCKGVVYGVQYDENMNVVHFRSETLDSCEKFKTSKYVQSDLSNNFTQLRKDLNNERYVLFVGTPCQVQGLKKFLGKDYDKLYLCDIICHGVSSPLAFSQYIRFIEKKYQSRVVDCNMRDKSKGWEHSRIRVYLENGEQLIDNPVVTSWLTMYFAHYMTRPVCHNCKFSNLCRSGDITIGDYWGIKKYYPDLYEEKGVSLLYINSLKGENLLQQIKNRFKYREVQIDKTEQYALLYPPIAHKFRDDIVSSFKKGGYENIYRLFLNPSFFNKLRLRLLLCLK